MKKTFYIGLCLTLLTLLCQGCQKEPLNSDIEGHWQLLEFTTKADGVVHPCERIYYSIQLWPRKKVRCKSPPSADVTSTMPPPRPSR